MKQALVPEAGGGLHGVSPSRALNLELNQKVPAFLGNPAIMQPHSIQNQGFHAHICQWTETIFVIIPDEISLFLKSPIKVAPVAIRT